MVLYLLMNNKQVTLKKQMGRVARWLWDLTVNIVVVYILISRS